MGRIMAHHRIFWTTNIHQKLIGLTVRLVTGMEIFRYFLHRNDINIFWRLGIQGKPQLFFISSGREVKVNDLPKRMNAAVGPTSSVDDNGLAFVDTS